MTAEALTGAYTSGQISSLDFLEGLVSRAAEAKNTDDPALSAIYADISSHNRLPVIISRIISDIDGLVQDMQKYKVTPLYQLDIRRRLREIIWIKYRIKDNDFYEAAYSYISNYYTN